jgi:CheY-like chemotaxis protein
MDKNEPTVDTAPLSDIRVLIIDDDHVISALAKKALEHLGATVQIAFDPVKALGTYARDKATIDLVIVDYFMPLLNGGETIQHLRKLNPDVKILLFSGAEELRLRQIIQQYSISGFLHKPLRVDETLYVIRQILPVRSERVAKDPLTPVT